MTKAAMRENIEKLGRTGGSMANDDEQPKGAQKGADFSLKPERAPKRRAALAAALRANLARRKARDRATRDPAQARDGGDSKTSSEG